MSGWLPWPVGRWGEPRWPEPSKYPAVASPPRRARRSDGESLALTRRGNEGAAAEADEPGAPMWAGEQQDLCIAYVATRHSDSVEDPLRRILSRSAERQLVADSASTKKPPAQHTLPNRLHSRHHSICPRPCSPRNALANEKCRQPRNGGGGRRADNGDE